jgi:hypothetical protein
MKKYQRYEKRYNERTTSAAVNGNRHWTTTEEARLLRTWCRASASAAVRIHAARVLGRTYVACAKRHARLHRQRGDWNQCRANQRRLGS